MRKIILVSIISLVSFAAGYYLNEFETLNYNFLELESEINCPYLEKQTSAGSYDECPFLNKKDKSECPFKEENNGKSEGKKRQLISV